MQLSNDEKSKLIIHVGVGSGGEEEEGMLPSSVAQL